MEIDLIKIAVTVILSAAAGVLVAIYVLPKIWIQSRFNKDFEHFRIKNLHEFDFLLSQRTKSHEKEYEVLTQVWKNLTDLLMSVAEFINPRPYIADLDIMDDERLEIFFKDNEITDSERKYLTDEKNKTGIFLNAYAYILHARAERDAVIAIRNFIQYFHQYRVFLKPDIKKKFEKLHDTIEDAVILQQKVEIPDDIGFGEEARKKFSDEVVPLVSEMEAMIQETLFPQEQQNN